MNTNTNQTETELAAKYNLPLSKVSTGREPNAQDVAERQEREQSVYLKSVPKANVQRVGGIQI